MNKLILEFKSPKELNELKETKTVEKKKWTYSGVNDSTLELDTETWIICCPQNNVSAKIDQWLVDETNFCMKLKSEKSESNFWELDYSFSVAMIGQLVAPNVLAKYLKQLEEVFEKTEQETPHDDLPKEDEKNKQNL